MVWSRGIEPWTIGLASQHYTIELKRLFWGFCLPISFHDWSLESISLMCLKIQCFDIHNNCRETCHNAHHNSRCDTQRKTNRDTQCEAIRYSCNSRNIFLIKFIQNLILKNLLWHHHWNNCKPAALSKHRIVVLVNAQEYLEWQTRLETIPLVINTNILKFFFPILQIQTWVMFLQWFAIRVC